MNVFVVSPGRTGTLSFSNACSLIENFSSGHETRLGMLCPQKLDYPENHIECDNRLAWLMGPLHERFTNDTVLVYLKRDLAKVAASYDKRWHVKHGIVRGYADSILMLPSRLWNREAALDFVTVVDRNIAFAARLFNDFIEINIDNPDDGFYEFWSKINAIGDYEAALSVLKTPANAGVRPSRYRRLRYAVTRAVNGIEEALRS